MNCNCTKHCIVFVFVYCLFSVSYCVCLFVDQYSYHAAYLYSCFNATLWLTISMFLSSQNCIVQKALQKYKYRAMFWKLSCKTWGCKRTVRGECAGKKISPLSHQIANYIRNLYWILGLEIMVPMSIYQGDQQSKPEETQRTETTPTLDDDGALVQVCWFKISTR